MGTADTRMETAAEDERLVPPTSVALMTRLTVAGEPLCRKAKHVE